jgi:hypothetical protein
LENILLDHGAHFFIAAPCWVLAVITGPCAQYEVDDLVAEVFGITDTRWFLNLLQLFVD